MTPVCGCQRVRRAADLVPELGRRLNVDRADVGVKMAPGP